MKKFMAMFLACGIILGGAAAFAPPKANVGEVAQAASAEAIYKNNTNLKIATVTVTNASTVNVRASAGTDYSKVGSVKKGEKYAVYGIAKDSAQQYWYRIQLKNSGTYGWIMQNYASYGSEVALKSGGTISIAKSAGNINIRSGPGTSYSKVGTANSSNGAIKFNAVAYSKTGLKFYRITWNGKTAWISGTAGTTVKAGTGFVDYEAEDMVDLS